MKFDWDAFLASRKGKMVLIGAAAVLLVGLIILVWMAFRRPQTPNIEQEIYDPISGDTVRILDQDPEEPWDGVFLLGFGVFGEIGFTGVQQEIIFATVRDFFSEGYPDISQLSLSRNSISYDITNEDITWFELISDTEETFRVKLDIEGSIFRVAVYIYDEAGNRLN
ncbi:hypothetical protein FWG76_01340 [Candidatus Saccharibacteria bacterium]|nr:hypothetical protein [Candidatus Saccharibacteria bacterium]